MKRVFRLIKKIIIAFIILSILLVLIFRFINPPGTMLMVQQKIADWDGKQVREWRNFDMISDNIKIAVIAAEDQNFVNHFGFDVDAIERAITYNENSQNIRGASTITQQVAKNLFLWPSRSFIRKGFELWFTLWIELFWSKERILEVYLNSVEWGNGIFGIEAAAQYYFNTSAKKLTLGQASLLAAILPNPRNLSPTHPSQNVINKARWIQEQVKNLDKNSYLNKISSH
ncbi:monofunctional biosynthetic peptidoglycan transglycosylase [Orbus mooreae]|uniref:monofunctional biosynthetic peptidoglycan transglycosylase n=1 Tax=Orbus mooreae TaxID=3074107 RepID=UPI00370D9FC8